MKKISILLAALVLSVSALAQSGGGTFFDPNNSNNIANAPAPTSVTTSANGNVVMNYPNGKSIVLESTATPGRYRVLSSNVDAVPQGYITTGRFGTYTAAGGGVVTGYGLVGLGVVILISNTPNKGTIAGTTGSV